MKLLSIFVGKSVEVSYQEKLIPTGIYKNQITGPARVSHLNIEGDQQADLTVHGGENKAIYAYPEEHYSFWKDQRLDLDFSPGIFGENLSVTGFDEATVFVGDQFKVGSIEVQVTTPRMPCFKLGIKMGDPKFVKDFLVANKTGFYFKVLKEGEIDDGQVFEKTGDDGHGLSISEVVRLYSADRNNKTLLEKAVSSPSLPLDWTEFFEKRLAKL